MNCRQAMSDIVIQKRWGDRMIIYGQAKQQNGDRKTADEGKGRR